VGAALDVPADRGSELFIAEKTAENDVRDILGEFHLTRRAELIR
jgi:hypothetical protein